MKGARSAQHKADRVADTFAAALNPGNTSDPTRARLRCGRFELALSRPLVMGIVNVTPDSFSDGGNFLDPQLAAAHARRLIDEGADILDIGGESTRPGARQVPVDDELARVIPVVAALANAGVPVSVDTSKPEVMRAALAAGASMINDITALESNGALGLMATSDCAVCLMHMQNNPTTMQQEPVYQDVVAEVKAYLASRIEFAIAAGVARNRIVIDPGFGFGKNAAHNFSLLRDLREFAALGVPVLAGLSRKSSIGLVTRRAVGERSYGSVAAALLAVERGADIVRVHDVAATRDALAVYAAMQDAQ